jgi:predicted  nucleic acid-binding Zn-ribbon protein
MAILNHTCEECDSTFTIKYDDEVVADAPHFCPFCGEMLIETDEIQRDDD